MLIDYNQAGIEGRIFEAVVCEELAFHRTR